MTRVALALAIMFLIASVGAMAGADGTPPKQLTSHGRLVWEFEALLRDTFGRTPVCEGPSYGQFVTRPCSPLATYNAYEFTFADARGSAFARASHRPTGLGNVVPVRVGGRFVRCGPSRWLVLLGSGVFPLDCIRSRA